MDEFDQYFNFGGETDAAKRNDETRGEDIRLDLEVDFLDALKGSTVEVEITKQVICPECNGTRAAPN